MKRGFKQPKNAENPRWDHFLVNEERDNVLGIVAQSMLPWPVSDRSPISIEGGQGPIRGLFSFHFKKMWLEEVGFKDMVKIWSYGLRREGSNSFILAQKLIVVKIILEVRNGEVFGRVETNKATAVSRVKYWDD